MDIKKNDVKKMALMIDHTILKASATKEQIIKYCNEAKKYDFASVCVNPYNVKLVSEQLKGTRIKVCTVIGFPLGANFVKTSTGFGTEGAVVLDIMLIKNNIEAKTNIKASGSIKNLKSALQMIEAGAT